MAATASSIRPSVDSRIAVSPAQIASNVMKFGTSIRTGIGRNRRRRGSGYLGSDGIMAYHYIASMRPLRHRPASQQVRPSGWLIGAVGPPVITEFEIGQNGLPGHRGLALGDQRFGAFGQIDVEPRSKADQAEPLARTDRLPLAHE